MASSGRDQYRPMQAAEYNTHYNICDMAPSGVQV